MYTTIEITEKYEKLAQSLNVIFDTPVMINGRLKTTLGRVVSDINNGKLFPRRIEISKHLLETATKESIDEVLVHEFCHWYLATTTHEDHGHDAVFKSLCKQLGGGDGKTRTEVKYRVATQKVYKYQCYCEKCGKEIGQYSRAGEVVKHPDQFTTSCCKGSIKVIQNW